MQSAMPEKLPAPWLDPHPFSKSNSQRRVGLTAICCGSSAMQIYCRYRWTEICRVSEEQIRPGERSPTTLSASRSIRMPVTSRPDASDRSRGIPWNRNHAL